MDGLCCEGEEKFGLLKARIYALALRWRRAFVQFVVNDILFKNPQSVLDIGCGPGDILMELQHHNIKLYGTDPSPHMLELASKRVRNSAPSAKFSVQLSLGSSRVIPFDRKFDMIFSSISFHHWKTREENIPYILSRLENDGEFTIYEYDKDAQSLLRKMILGKHSLSANEAKDFQFAGYAKTIVHIEPFIIVRFKKIS